MPASPRPLTEPDPLDDFTPRHVDIDGLSRTVHVSGTGPAVIVMPEMPGISPHVARFARWVRDAGSTAWMPSLFGRDGAVPGVEESVAIFRRACVAAEFRALRFDGDRFCTAQRFAAYSAALGDRFEPRVPPDAAANMHDLPPFLAQVVQGPHSAVTVHLVDQAGQPTLAARDEILAFLAERLQRA